MHRGEKWVSDLTFSTDIHHSRSQSISAESARSYNHLRHHLRAGPVSQSADRSRPISEVSDPVSIPHAMQPRGAVRLSCHPSGLCLSFLPSDEVCSAKSPVITAGSYQVSGWEIRGPEPPADLLGSSLVDTAVIEVVARGHVGRHGGHLGRPRTRRSRRSLRGHRGRLEVMGAIQLCRGILVRRRPLLRRMSVTAELSGSV